NCNITALSHPCLTIKDGIAIEDEEFLYLASQKESIVIPDGIATIGENAFFYCYSLELVSIPQSVKEIHGNPFAGCVIRELYHPCFTIKAGIAVRDNKFLYCERLRSSITIPDGVFWERNTATGCFSKRQAKSVL
ncbi:MAG: leucine-rich repeat protein, partial [Treponema sp.]|nr:leucine-rich repeat protein [Treponema sp.]MBR6913103.1 leucine-rich repeat protein [Treponema sp.]